MTVSVVGAVPAQAKEPRKRPNVLFMAIDDPNDWVGPLGGHPQTRTPNLDRLATTSVLFERAYASSPACVPSRSALLTGKAAYVTGLYSNYQTWTEVVGDELKLPRHFRDHGYHTIGTGKIFHNGAPDPTAGTDYWPSLTKDLVPTVCRRFSPSSPFRFCLSLGTLGLGFMMILVDGDTLHDRMARARVVERRL